MGVKEIVFLFYDPLDVEKFELFNSKKNIYEKEISSQLLEEMVAYIESLIVEEKKFSTIFGEQHQTKHCDKKCDNCNQKYIKRCTRVNCDFRSY